MDLSGRVALITGGAHRVGRGIVVAVAAAGADVFIHYGRSADLAEQTAADARALGVRAATGTADLADAAAPADLMAQVTDALATPSVLVNSASQFPTDTLATLTGEGWDRTMRLSVRAPVFLTQAFAAALAPDAEGAVVNVTDWRVARPYPDHFSYVVAKGALDAFTRAAAVSLAPRIRVNAVALGAILPPPGKDTAHLKELAGTLPLQRTGSPELVGEAVVSLLRNDFVTGEIWRVDGGAHLA